MPLKKYFNDEDRYQAMRESRHKYYLKKKEDEEYKQKSMDYHKKYHENNKEKRKEYRLKYYYNNKDKENENRKLLRIRNKEKNKIVN